jgi:hypothetical protein
VCIVLAAEKERPRPPADRNIAIKFHCERRSRLLPSCTKLRRPGRRVQLN